MRVFAFLLLLALATPAMCQQNIFETLNNGNTTTLYNLINTNAALSGVKTALQSAEATITLFAPTNAALEGVIPPADDTEFAQTVLYHALGFDAVSSGDLQPAQAVETLATNQSFVNLGQNDQDEDIGQNLFITKDDNGVTIRFGLNTASVTKADVTATNGVIHEIDTFMTLPPSASVTATNAGLSSLVTALTDTDLAGTVDDATAITIFAPVNSAFDGIQIGLADTADTLTLHVSSNLYFSTDLADGTNSDVPTLSTGNTLQVIKSETDGSVTVQSTANQVPAGTAIVNIPVKNGVVHVIDNVIDSVNSANNIAENAKLAGLSTLYTLVSGSQTLTGALTNEDATLTVFAPTDAAFTDAGIDATNESLVESTVLYHAVGSEIQRDAIPVGLTILETASADNDFVQLNAEGQRIKVTATANQANVTIATALGADEAEVVTVANQVNANGIFSSNGVVHVVDEVLTLPGILTEVAADANLNKLLEAVTAVDGLAATLLAAEGITIFAPTDAAFDAFTDDISSIDTATLEEVLKYHVVPALGYSTGLSDGDELATLQGEDVEISINSAGVKVNDANVAVANALISNGVVHVIDKVLTPAGDDSPAAQAYPTAILVAALLSALVAFLQ